MLEFVSINKSILQLENRNVFEEDLFIAGFLSLSFSVNFQYQRTPLHLAAEEGHTETCALLVKSGAAVDAVDEVRGCVIRQL